MQRCRSYKFRTVAFLLELFLVFVYLSLSLSLSLTQKFLDYVSTYLFFPCKRTSHFTRRIVTHKNPFPYSHEISYAYVIVLIRANLCTDRPWLHTKPGGSALVNPISIALVRREKKVLLYCPGLRSAQIRIGLKLYHLYLQKCEFTIHMLMRSVMKVSLFWFGLKSLHIKTSAVALKLMSLIIEI